MMLLLKFMEILLELLPDLMINKNKLLILE
jgi:hypothetical protein